MKRLKIIKIDELGNYRVYCNDEFLYGSSNDTNIITAYKWDLFEEQVHMFWNLKSIFDFELVVER